MKIRRTLIIAMAAILAMAMSGAGQQSADQLYRAGLYEEEVGGDLQKAIGIYQDILKRFPASREIAAKAQLHIGLCFEKLGTSEAEKAFQKVVDNYPEQSDAVREAREKLTALLRARVQAKTDAAPFSTRRIWSGSGVDAMGAVSPDGRYLSYVDWDTGDLALRDLAAGTNRRLTNKGTWQQSSEFAMYSKWSPDGHRVAYQWYGKDDILELRVLDTRDSSIRTIVRDKSNQDWAQAFDWSPDGETVLVAFWDAATSTQSNRGRVGLVSLKDGSVRMLKGHFESLSAYNFGWGFCFSPDGRHIAYNAPRSFEEPGNDDIFLISLDDGSEERLVEHPGHDVVVGWTPDDCGLLFTSDRTGSQDLYLLPLSNGRPLESPQLIKSGIGTITPLGITPRGDLYYGLGGGGTDIYVAEIGGRPEAGHVQAKKLALPYQGRNMFPDFAPDGDRIAFLSTPPGRGGILGIVSQKEGRVREFRLGLPMYVCPRWIPPDGRSLSVQGRDKDGLSVLYRVVVETEEVSPIVSLEKGWSFHDRTVWAPDGKRVYYCCGVSTEKGRSIHVHDLETGRSRRLSGSPDDAASIAISPNGKWLAVLNSQGRRSLRIMPAAGGELREVHGFENESGAVITLAWSADGRGIYVPKLKDPEKNIWDIYRVPLDGGDAEKIDLGLGRIGFPSVRPGGSEIAFQSTGAGPQPSEVWVMENFLPPAPVVKSETGLRVRKVWDDALDSLFGTPSPDGRYLTYSAERDFLALGVRDLVKGESRLLAPNKSWTEADYCYDSVFSPDGSRIAYACQAKGGLHQLRIIDRDGSSMRILHDGQGMISLGPFAWTSDGSQILTHLVKPDRSHKIAFIAAADGSVKNERELPFNPDAMSLSPDGRYIACTFQPNAGSADKDVLLYSLEGDRVATLVEHPAEDAVIGWSPDGAQVLFTSDRTGSTGIWTVPVAGGKATGPPELVRGNLGHILTLGLARDGTLFYRTFTGPGDVFTASVDPRTGSVLSPPVKAFLKYETFNSTPDWSPDGQSLVCRSSRGKIGNAPPVLLIRSMQTGEVRELVPKTPGGRLMFYYLRWSPDGRSFLGIGRDEKGEAATLLLVDAQSGEAKVLTRPDHLYGSGNIIAPDWSPDGRAVHFIRIGSTFRRICSLDLGTGIEKEIYRSEKPSGPFWLASSPCGRELAFLEEGKIKIMSRDSTAIRELAESDSGLVLAWMPDGKNILFSRAQAGNKDGVELWRVPAAGGEPQKAGLSVSGLILLRVSPDGKTIAFTAIREEKSEVWVMENFLPKSRTNK